MDQWVSVIGAVSNCRERWDCGGQHLFFTHWDIIGEQCGFAIRDLCNKFRGWVWES